MNPFSVLEVYTEGNYTAQFFWDSSHVHLSSQHHYGKCSLSFWVPVWVINHVITHHRLPWRFQVPVLCATGLQYGCLGRWRLHLTLSVSRRPPTSEGLQHGPALCWALGYSGEQRGGMSQGGSGNITKGRNGTRGDLPPPGI